MVSRLLSPGAAERPGGDRELVARMLDVEVAWAAVLHRAGRIGPKEVTQIRDAARALADRSDTADSLVAGTSNGGNPAIPLVAILRRELEPVSADAAWIVHRGLTSQDTLDTALVLIARDVLDAVRDDLGAAVVATASLASRHRTSLMIGRTLTQQATPTTFGLRAAGWLQGLTSAVHAVTAARATLAVQCGGAVGTLAAIAELVPGCDPLALSADLAHELGLQPALPWHVERSRITRLGGALAATADAFGHIATDVATLSRTEIGELGEPAAAGRGGSSTLPGKRNPVLSVEIRRAALGAPHDLAALHIASTLAVDDRPDGAWHSEWQPLVRLLDSARTVTTLGRELLEGLEVHTETMRAHLDRALPGALAERESMHRSGDAASEAAGPEGYLGAADQIVDQVLKAAEEIKW